MRLVLEESRPFCMSALGQEVDEHVVCISGAVTAALSQVASAVVMGPTRLLGVGSRLCLAVPLGQQE